MAILMRGTSALPLLFTQLLLFMCLCKTAWTNVSPHENNQIWLHLRRTQQACHSSDIGCAKRPVGQDVENCVYECVSRTCYQKIFSTEPVRLNPPSYPAPVIPALMHKIVDPLTNVAYAINTIQLEEGQVDYARTRLFMRCAFKEQLHLRLKKRRSSPATPSPSVNHNFEL